MTTTSLSATELWKVRMCDLSTPRAVMPMLDTVQAVHTRSRTPRCYNSVPELTAAMLRAASVDFVVLGSVQRASGLRQDEVVEIVQPATTVRA